MEQLELLRAMYSSDDPPLTFETQAEGYQHVQDPSLALYEIVGQQCYTESPSTIVVGERLFTISPRIDVWSSQPSCLATPQLSAEVYSPLFPDSPVYRRARSPIPSNIEWREDSPPSAFVLTLRNTGLAVLYNLRRGLSHASSHAQRHLLGLGTPLISITAAIGRSLDAVPARMLLAATRESLVLAIDRLSWLRGLTITRGNPPPVGDWQLASTCFVCRREFGLGLFRHHCRGCFHTFCAQHSRHRRFMQGSGAVEVRVCSVCALQKDHEEAQALRQERATRVTQYLLGGLSPFTAPRHEGLVSRVARVGGMITTLLRNTVAATSLPIKVAVEAVTLLQRYGASGLIGLAHSGDFAVALQQLQKISGLGLTGSEALPLHTLTLCVYVKMALDRRAAGSAPEQSLDDHGGCGLGMGQGQGQTSGCAEVSDDVLNDALRLAPLALFAAYQPNLVELQVDLGNCGFVPLHADLTSSPDEPSFVLCATATRPPHSSTPTLKEKEAVVIVRGTHSMGDFLTDLRAIPAPFPPPADVVRECLQGFPRSDLLADYLSCLAASLPPQGQQGQVGQVGEEGEEGWEWLEGEGHRDPRAYACKGVISAALHVLRAVGPDLRRLHAKGFCIKVVGHSLGGSIAALLVWMLRDEMPCHGFGYGVPCCLDLASALSLAPDFTAVVLGDDMVSRVTPSSLRRLLEELACLKGRAGQLLESDTRDVVGRVLDAWKPRERGAGTRTGNTDTASSSLSLPPPSAPPQAHQTSRMRDLYLPGSIVHLFRHRGLALVASVPQEFPPLRRLSLSDAVFDDHFGEAILSALREAASGRLYRNSPAVLSGLAAPFPRPWEAHDLATRCRLCGEKFAWQATANSSECASYRLTHNCNQCGRLVCGKCSTRTAFVGFGAATAKRVCDRCLWLPPAQPATTNSSSSSSL